MILELGLIEFVVVEGSEAAGETPEVPDQCQLHAYKINHEAEAPFLGKLQTFLCLGLCLLKRFAHR